VHPCGIGRSAGQLERRRAALVHDRLSSYLLDAEPELELSRVQESE
jgi:hypothetical protein